MRSKKAIKSFPRQIFVVTDPKEGFLLAYESIEDLDSDSKGQEVAVYRLDTIGRVVTDTRFIEPDEPDEDPR